MDQDKNLQPIFQAQLQLHKRNADFKMYYELDRKYNVWVLGYFGGGALNVVATLSIAREFAEVCNVPLESVMIDEIHTSRRFKGFKYVYSHHPGQEPVNGSDKSYELWKWLMD